MTTIFANVALLDSGWSDRVRLHISDGAIAAVESGCTSNSTDYVVGTIIPGIPNAHSHVFQRALNGHCEYRSPEGKDNFWTWRVQMYRLAGLIDPTELAAIARQAYCEMVTSGYTSVAEFHYLHRDGAKGGNLGAMYEAISSAASDSGIRLTYVPVLYEQAGFDRAELTSEQRRFAMSLEEYADHFRQANDLAPSTTTVGVGAHSLRAVSPRSLEELANLANIESCPIHIHIAEQLAEVENCLVHYGARPIEWLVKNLPLNNLWCLVHATHISDSELETLADTDVVVCLCPSTEANLGDGIFPLRPWLERGGRIAVGSDSQITINPFEELRWLEYGQRLSSLSRNVASVDYKHVGRNLFSKSLQGGSTACGNRTGQLRPGEHADFLVLDDESATLAGHSADSILDALVFSGTHLPISHVMIDGEWRVKDYKHVIGNQVKRDFHQVACRLWEQN